MAEAVAARHRPGTPPRRAGRHRDRQVARLPRAGRPRRPHHGRGHRHQGAPGPADHEGPPVPRRAPRPGRSSGPSSRGGNYLCLQRVREVRDAGERPARARRPEALGPSARCERLSAWAGQTHDRRPGRARPGTPTDRAWAAVSVSSEECPGASRCPLGEPCFAEAARRRAAAADVVVVNTHLYGLDVGDGGRSAARARRGGDRRGAPARGHHVGHHRRRRRRRPLRQPGPAGPADPRGPCAARRPVGRRVRARRRARRPCRVSVSPSPLPVALAKRPHRRPPPDRRAASPRFGAIETDVADADQRRAARPEGGDHAGRGPRRRARRRPIATSPGWAAPPRARGSRSPRSTSRPCWRRACGPGAPPSSRRATVPLSLPGAGRPARRRHRPARRRQPLRLRDQRPPLLRRPPARPPSARPPPGRDPRELEALIAAAGGRTLALFTSRRAMLEAAAEAMRPTLPFTILTQDDLPEAGADRALHGGGDDVPVRHGGPLPGDRRARAGRSPS